MSSSTFAGIVHHERDGSLTHLPLEEVRVNAFIVDGAYFAYNTVLHHANDL